jgi:hypothetical protein
MFLLISCNQDDDNPNQSLSLNITGLEDLGSNFRYEGWLIVNGQPVTTGTFTVNSSGAMSSNSFTVGSTDLSNATKFVLTIEPFPDSDPSPTATHLLAGDFSGNSANLTIEAPEALGNNFASATGKYILATPSDGAMNNEKSGVWFLGSLPPTAGLSLPTLPAGWAYEGWAVIGGAPVSTGTFTSVSGADNFNGFSGSMGTPPYPGEDFLLNAPSGLTFPTDLSGAKIVISIEPSPDNSAAPFFLKPLLGDVPASAMSETVYNMNNISSSNAPTGIASR